MANKTQLTLEAATVAIPLPDPALVRWLGASGLSPADSRKLAALAARRTQFMPADIKAAYLKQLTAARRFAERQLLQRARAQLNGDRLAPP